MYDLHIGPDRSVFGPSLHLDRTDRSKQLRWTEPIGPGDTDGPDRTNSIGSIRLGLKSGILWFITRTSFVVFESETVLFGITAFVAICAFAVETVKGFVAVISLIWTNLTVV